MPSACCALSSSPLRHAAPSDSIHLVTQCLTAANKRGFERILVPINAATQAEGGEAGGAGGPVVEVAPVVLLVVGAQAG